MSLLIFWLWVLVAVGFGVAKWQTSDMGPASENGIITVVMWLMWLGFTVVVIVVHSAWFFFFK